MDDDSEYANFMSNSKRMYEDALRSLPNLEPPPEFADCAALTTELVHNTLLEELVFWTVRSILFHFSYNFGSFMYPFLSLCLVQRKRGKIQTVYKNCEVLEKIIYSFFQVKYEFPERLVCLLLKLLPDTHYKEALTRSFVRHYSRVSMMLMKSHNSDKLSNRIVHVSVQLFSNEELALAMTEQMSLLYIMVLSLKNMIKDVLIKCELHDETLNRHKVVDNSKHVLRDHCYWPLVSDLNNVLNHPSIAFKFMADNSLLTMWFDFLKVFQGEFYYSFLGKNPGFSSLKFINFRDESKPVGGRRSCRIRTEHLLCLFYGRIRSRRHSHVGISLPSQRRKN